MVGRVQLSGLLRRKRVDPLVDLPVPAVLTGEETPDVVDLTRVVHVVLEEQMCCVPSWRTAALDRQSARPAPSCNTVSLCAASREDPGFTEPLGQLRHLPRRPRIDPIEDRRPKRQAGTIDRQQTGADPADADADDAPGRSAGELPADRSEIRSPDCFSIMLGPAGSRHRQCMRPIRRRDDRAVNLGQYPLRARRPDVDPEKEVSHEHSRSRRSRPRGAGRRSAALRRGRPGLHGCGSRRSARGTRRPTPRGG